MGRRRLAPILVPVVVTPEGFLGTATLTLIDEITAEFRTRQRRICPGRDDWNVDLPTRVARFKADFRAHLVFAAVSRTAAMQLVAGTPWTPVRYNKRSP